MKTNLKLLIIFAAFPILFSACHLGRDISQQIRQAEDIIDRGITDIETQSASWQTVLQRVAQDLPDKIDQTIRNDAQNLASRSIAQAGTEIRCNVDFLANRAINGLKNLKKELHKENPDKLLPNFCQVVPAAIDLNANPNSWAKVTIYGYDMDFTDNNGNRFGVFMIREDGTSIALPENRIGRTTHYEVNLNLGGLQAQIFNERIVKFRVVWNGNMTTPLPEILVLPWNAKTQGIELNPEIISYIPPRTHGDADFDTSDDEPTDVTLRGEFIRTDYLIDGRVYMKARERDPDNTTVEGSTQARIYTAPPNWKIVNVNPAQPSFHTAVVTDHGFFNYNRPSGEVVSFFKVWVDRDGDEAGSYTHMEVHWRTIHIDIREEKPSWLQ